VTKDENKFFLKPKMLLGSFKAEKHAVRVAGLLGVGLAGHYTLNRPHAAWQAGVS
jgi:hypothetical protein